MDALEAETKELQEKENKLEAEEDKLQAEKKKLQEKEDKLQKLLVKVGKVWEAGAQLADIEGEVHDFGIFGGVEDAFWELKSKLAEVKQEKANVSAILVQVATESAYEAKRKASLADVQATLAKESAAKRMRLTSEPSSASRIVRSHTVYKLVEDLFTHDLTPAGLYSGVWENHVWNGLKGAGGEAGTEDELQTAFNERLSRLGESVTWVDTHATPLGDGMKPDLSCVAGSAAVSQHNCIAVIELQHPGQPLTTDNALGQLFDGLTDLQDAQPRRVTVRGLLFNGRSAVEMCCTRTAGDEFAWSMTEEKTGDAAWNLLRGFMTASAGSLGACRPITVKGVDFVTGKRVGRGSSCQVYSVEDTGEVKNAVIKIYDHTRVMNAEKKCLKSFTGTAIAPFVPKVVASEKRYLVVTPYAHKFKRGEFCAEHAAHLMGILKHVHTAMGLVHRDVRPANFFNVPQSEGQPGVLLNDWASSVRAGEVVHYAGSPGLFKADWLPDDGSRYTAQPKDDLYSFVMSCYDLADATQGYYKLPTAWEAVCAACRNDADHDTVLDAVMKLLPRAQN